MKPVQSLTQQPPCATVNASRSWLEAGIRTNKGKQCSVAHSDDSPLPIPAQQASVELLLPAASQDISSCKHRPPPPPQHAFMFVVFEGSFPSISHEHAKNQRAERNVL